MHFEDFKSNKQALYGDFADTIRFILDRAIKSSPGIPRPQAVQARAKSIDSLERKLRERNLFSSNSIEDEIRDLAGVRLIFYTNGDVNRFLLSRLVADNFTIDEAATRIYHPTLENENAQYRGIHYTVTLNGARSSLPEYARFAGLRCEIQIQTILNHAWSETTHDILYKRPEAPGFGSKGFDTIAVRMRRVMDKYLLPAGYEIQKTQYDYLRILEGKELFDRGSLEALESCSNNNERYDLLVKLEEYVIPNYDDLAGIYPDLNSALLEALAAARKTQTEPIETPFGELPGKSADDIAYLIISILGKLRYVNVEGSFSAFLEILKNEKNPDSRRQLLKCIEELAHYDLSILEKAGLAVQVYLSERLDSLSLPNLLADSTAALIVYRELLSPEANDWSCSHDKVTFKSASLNASTTLAKVREQAINGLFKLLGAEVSDGDRRTIISILADAGRLPNQSGYSDELCQMVLADRKAVLDRVAGYIALLSFELRETLEEQLLFEFRRAKQLAENDKFAEPCRAAASALVTSVLALRDQFNEDEEFVRFKTFVGYEAVFPPDWEDEDFDKETYRLERVDEFLENINESTFSEWRTFIARCAAIESNDLATFPVFNEFLMRLGQRRPSLVASILKDDDPHLARFLPAFLYGLSSATDRSHYSQAIAAVTADPNKHAALIRHYRKVGPPNISIMKQLLESAVAREDNISVSESVILVIEQYNSENHGLKADLFLPALDYLTSKADIRWVQGVWFLQRKAFFEGLSPAEAQCVLDNLVTLDNIDHRGERLLIILAERYPELVWQFFGRRLKDCRLEGKKGRAFPFQFHGLEVPLNRDPQLAVRIVQEWYTEGDPLFRFDGARLLANVFRDFPRNFAAVLSSAVAEEGTKGADFALAVLENYHAEETVQEIARKIVDKLPDEDNRLSRVEIALQSSGVVSGEFGMVAALRERKARLVSWLTDGRPKVVRFAKHYITKLDRMIAAQQRTTEEESELWKRSFDSDDSDPDEDPPIDV